MRKPVVTVTFVINHPESTINRLAFCGHLLQQWLSQNAAPFCLTSDADYAEFLDDYLWSDAYPFLPHMRADYDPKIPQVYIGTEISQAGSCPSIFNCTNQALDVSHAHDSVEIVEWVSNDPAEKDHMRNVFTQYKSQKINPKTVRI